MEQLTGIVWKAPSRKRRTLSTQSAVLRKTRCCTFQVQMLIAYKNSGRIRIVVDITAHPFHRQRQPDGHGLCVYPVHSCQKFSPDGQIVLISHISPVYRQMQDLTAY